MSFLSENKDLLNKCNPDKNQLQNLQLKQVDSFGAFEWILVLFWIAFGVMCALEIKRPKKQASKKQIEGIQYNAINDNEGRENML